MIGYIIADEWQGRGFGTILVKELVNIGNNLGLSIHNRINKENIKSIKLAQKVGFVINKESKDYYILKHKNITSKCKNETIS